MNDDSKSNTNSNSDDTNDSGGGGVSNFNKNGMSMNVNVSESAVRNIDALERDDLEEDFETTEDTQNENDSSGNDEMLKKLVAC